MIGEINFLLLVEDAVNNAVLGSVSFPSFQNMLPETVVDIVHLVVDSFGSVDPVVEYALGQ